MWNRKFGVALGTMAPQFLNSQIFHLSVSIIGFKNFLCCILILRDGIGNFQEKGIVGLSF